VPGPFYFAWAGGTIQDQVIVVTTGHTHGGQIETVPVIGDTQAGVGFVKNVASNQALEQSTLYLIEGPGVSAFFMIEEALQPSPEWINMNSPAGQTLRGATFKATKSVPMDTGIATFAAGSNIVALDPALDLAPGYYGATGPAIGQCRDTGGGQDIQIGSAYLFHDGSGTGQMYAFAAVPPDAPSGVAQFEVIALLSGQYPLQLTGMASDDWTSVTSIPEAHLAGLTPGLTYNIAGNGIATGTTFVAPDGGTSITLSQPASSSERALLTITGPRTPNAPFDPATHNRFDEDVLDIEIAHEEGGFATLKVRVRNPAVGLLAPGRNLWAWLSWDQAWTPDGGATPDLLPLFNGRLVGVPRLQADEIVELEFIARPDDYSVQKAALTDELSVLPWYDPVWLASNVNEDTVLEAYSALWHVDRTTLEVSVSDIVQGEDGIIEISEGQALYDAFSLSYGQPPLNAVTLSGTVSWSQQASGLLDVTGPLVRAFSQAGSPLGNRPFPTSPANANINLGMGFGSRIKGGGALIAIMNGDGLFQDWPKPGTNIGGGWALSTEDDAGGTPLCFIHGAAWLGPEISYNVTFFGHTQPAEKGDTEEATNVNVFLHGGQIGPISVAFPVNNYKIRMILNYRADRKRTETINAVLVGDVQQMLSDTTDADRETVSFTSEYVAQGIDPGGEVPLGNLAYKSYFQTDRGSQSFEYLILAARAKLRARARAVDVTFATNWTDAIGLAIGLRNSVTLFDRRLPGGAATGKVKSYRLVVAGGTMRGEFTIGCSIGTGLPANAAIGVNSYVEDDYTDDYQVVAGGQIEILPSEIAYQALTDFVISDDGLNLPLVNTDNAVNSCTVVNGLDRQIEVAKMFQGVTIKGENPPDAMAELVTTVTLDMKPVTGSEFHTDFFPALTPLALPKTIDLEAS